MRRAPRPPYRRVDTSLIQCEITSRDREQVALFFEALRARTNLAVYTSVARLIFPRNRWRSHGHADPRIALLSCLRRELALIDETLFARAPRDTSHFSSARLIMNIAVD